MTNGVDLHGVLPYLVTPVKDDGRLDVSVFERLIRISMKAEVHGLTPLGSTGELPLVSASLREEVVRTAVEVAGGEIPVVPGVGAFDTGTAIAQARSAVAAGCDGILAVLYSYYRLNRAEVVAYFSAVAASVDVPVVLYHHPQLCGFSVDERAIAELSEVDNIRFIKDASGMVANISRWRDASDGRMGVFSSTSFSPSAAMLLGACGSMSGPATALPRTSVAVYELCREGRWNDALALESIVEPVLALFRRFGPPRTVKALLNVQGVEVGDPIPPLEALDRVALDEVARTWGKVRRELEMAGFGEDLG